MFEPTDDIYNDDWQSFGAADSDLLSEAEGWRIVNWRSLRGNETAAAWTDLDSWVHWLRRTYGLPSNVIPPFWHRHLELVWELSALHTHWLASYQCDASPAAPLLWHRDFAEARVRLREWVAACGTKLDRDRPTRQTAWPGEPAVDVEPELLVEDREADFAQHVANDVAARRRLEQGAGGLDDAD